MRPGLQGRREEGREGDAQRDRGEEELCGPSAPGSGCAGAPQGWSAQFSALLCSESWAGLPWALGPLARASILALVGIGHPAQALLRRGVWRSPESIFLLFLASALLHTAKGRH